MTGDMQKILPFPEVPKPLPPFPTRNETREFQEKVNLFLDSMPQFVESVNRIIDYLNRGTGNENN